MGSALKRTKPQPVFDGFPVADAELIRLGCADSGNRPHDLSNSPVGLADSRNRADETALITDSYLGVYLSLRTPSAYDVAFALLW